MRQPWQYLKTDLISGVVVYLVALPLCLGVALASNAPLISGIVSAIIGGIVIGMLSESRASVSGPAAGLIAVVLLATTQLGGFQAFLLALLLSGLLQIVIGVLRVGFIANYMPSNVIQGLLAAIGVVIIIKQIPLALGYDSDNIALEAVLRSAQESVSLHPFFGLATHFSLGAALISAVTLFIMRTWSAIPARLNRFLPSALVAVLVAVCLNLFFTSFVPSLALSHDYLVKLPVVSSVKGLVGQLTFPDFGAWKNPAIYKFAFVIAIVSSLETLLNLEAAEKLDKNRRYSSRNRELIAQGVGNSLAGLLGGLPITSVIIRSSVNINAGAKSKLSTIFHGFLFILSLLSLAKWLNAIPLAALAAILIFTGYKLCNAMLFRSAYRRGWIYFIPFMITTAAIVLIDLLSGILIGLMVSLLFILYQYGKKRFTQVCEHRFAGNVKRLTLPTHVTFLNKPSIITVLNEIPKHSKAIIDGRAVEYVDQDIIEVINEFRHFQAKDRDILLNIEGFTANQAALDQSDFTDVMSNEALRQLSPQDVVRLLQEGNQRFLHGALTYKNYRQQIISTAQTYHPLAIVLSCIDSRVPVELLFDLTIGDLLVTRVAGPVINKDVLACIEYACKGKGVKVIMVMGHTHCGAVKAACSGDSLGHITQLAEKIAPAIQLETDTKENRTKHNPDFVNNVMRHHITLAQTRIFNESEAVRPLIEAKTVRLVGAVYDVTSGEVTISEPFIPDRYK